jgi:hypothetical protein
MVVKPETLIAWHRKGFGLFWKWKSKGGRPRLPRNIRRLIAEMAAENPTWGEERVAELQENAAVMSVLGYALTNIPVDLPRSPPRPPRE